MKNLKTQNNSTIYTLVTILLTLFISFQTEKSMAQGCVAIKGNATTCMAVHADSTNVSSWQFASSGRYFKSFRQKNLPFKRLSLFRVEKIVFIYKLKIVYILYFKNTILSRVFSERILFRLLFF